MRDLHLVDVYVTEYRSEFAKRTKEIGREGERLRKQHSDIVGKIERLVDAVANGAETFVEIRDVLTKIRNERDRIADQLDRLEQLPAIVLHPAIVDDYRAQIAQLNGALTSNPEARLEAIPQLRALIDKVSVFPTDAEKGVQIEIFGRL